MSGRAWRLGLLTWALLLPVAVIAPLVAAGHAPAGRFYVGASFYPDDFLQYLSFAEQASRGGLLFVNKFDPALQAPVFANVEWWASGILSLVLGAENAFRTIGGLALLALALGVARVLVDAGLTGQRLVAGLVLVFIGEGLGWVRAFWGVSGSRIPDLLMGLYPWHQNLSNPHFLVGTALLLWSVIFHLDGRGGGPRWRWLATAWALGLCRPYDLAVFVAVVVGASAWDAWSSRSSRVLWPLLDLVWLAPVFAYYALLVRGHPSFGGWGTQDADVAPTLGDYFWSVLPALAVVIGAARGRAIAGSPLLRTLVVWCAIPPVLLATWADPMSKQCVVSWGTALLLLATLLSSARWLVAATVAGLPSAALVLAAALWPQPASYAPDDYRPAVRFLRSECDPGDVAIAPTDLSLLIAAHTPCHVALGHRLLTPGYEFRTSLGRRLYDRATAPDWRSQYLRAEGARFVLLPPGSERWLGPDPPFSIALRLPLLDVWRRSEARVTMPPHGNRGL